MSLKSLRLNARREKDKGRGTGHGLPEGRPKVFGLKRFFFFFNPVL